MATSVFCLALICLPSLIPPSQSAAPAARSEEAAEEFVLSEGPKSQLFSKCVKDIQTVEGILYSITVSEDEEFVRYVAEKKIDFEWTTVDLGDASSIIHCAQEAYRLSAYMFKFDGSCNVALNSSYDPKFEQGCDGADAEVVYITSRPFNSHNAHKGQMVPFGEFVGCYYSSPEGMRYDYERGNLVVKINLPTPATCCPTSEEGYCLFMNYLKDGGLTYCEANAYCDALGVPLAGKDFFEDFVGKPLEHPIDPASKKFIWINLKRINGTWMWVPEMEVFPHTPIYDEDDPETTGVVLEFRSNTFGNNDTEAERHYSRNTGVYCYERTTTLPQCL